jgi:hypothetical protein
MDWYQKAGADLSEQDKTTEMKGQTNDYIPILHLNFTLSTLESCEVCENYFFAMRSNI